MKTIIWFLLLAVALVTFPVGLSFGILGLVFELFKNGIKGFWKVLGDLFHGTAIMIDRWDNMMLGWILNIIMIGKGGHRFGNYNETISSAIGKNVVIGKLSMFGYFVNKLLDSIDSNHSVESINKKIVESVSDDLFSRQEMGIKKYGTTVDRTDLSRKDWLQHAYEEALDLSVYLKTAMKQSPNNKQQ